MPKCSFSTVCRISQLPMYPTGKRLPPSILDVFLSGNSEDRAKDCNRGDSRVSEIGQALSNCIDPVRQTVTLGLIGQRRHHLVRRHRLTAAIEPGEDLDSVPQIPAFQSYYSYLIRLNSVGKLLCIIDKDVKQLTVIYIFGQTTG